ncbi:MAG: aminotransferase class V-fold PLP-dependent enzyme [Gemmatimonadetes bacterium]|nr:aminotransferase class V-fold PLP-dependent enzyme [Gemmatimonadota bacterium]MBK7717501.1 aminotransferase class V-fold PLP-dependent enzyme [Gemmatimonadota bacterium]MBK9066927.1 aminotransferase class V-fold PLP-dependent enzyme [Gemmatimonadota bacterium]MBP6668519.1 aminotransferase class V-fold PLP-dependent enzyme [Gemmatimonadales bacterium]
MKSHAALDNLTRHRRLDSESVRAVPLRVPEGADQVTLLCPGPCSTSPRVKQALARQDISHRDQAFVDVLGRVVERLKVVAGAPGHEVLVTGGGATAVTEAVLATFVAQDERLLVVSNGAFGERIAEMAQCLGIHMSHLRYDWGEPIVLEQVQGMLDGDPRIRAVAMVHHETSVGRLNPVNEVGRLLAPRHIRYFVDVVSSLGAEDFDMVRSRASVAIGSANKCLHGVAGAAFVVVRKELWQETAHVRPRSMFLDLRRYRTAFKDNGQTPFTPPVTAVVALDAALAELEAEGGVPARRASYQALNARLRAGLLGLGLKLRYDGPGSASSLTVAQLPSGLSFDSFNHDLRTRGFLVYRGKGPVSHDSFLVANMGHIDLATIDRFLEAVRDIAGL